MSKNTLLDHYRRMKKQDIILAFRGNFSDKILEGMVETVKRTLTGKGEEEKISKKVFSVLIELAQNIRFYSEEYGRKGILIIEDRETCYQVSAGNLVRDTEVLSLRERIRHINNLGENELRSLYIRRLRTPMEPGKTGGNIGLIVVARKSLNPIVLTDHPAHKDHRFIEISVRIDKEGLRQAQSPANPVTGKPISDFSEKLRALKKKIWKCLSDFRKSRMF